MKKVIFKEIIIYFLLLVVVILVLGIIFYDYLPIDKQPPSKVLAYQVDEETNTELSKSTNGTAQNVVRTYQISSSDLSVYEKANEYEKGNPNPFQSIVIENPYNDTTTTNTSNQNTANSNIGNPNTNSTSKYYNSTSGK